MADDKQTSLACECEVIHGDVVSGIRATLPSDEKLIDLAEFFKVFGDSTRAKILNVLFEHEVCVCDLTALVGTSQSAVSHQLRILKQADMVKYRRDGKQVYYSLKDDHIKTIFDQAVQHLSELKP